MKLYFWQLGAFTVLAILVPLIGNWIFSSPPYRGPKSDHFDGKHFWNSYSQPRAHRTRDFFRWRWNRATQHPHSTWSDYREIPPGPKPPVRVEGNDILVTFVNHSSVLVQTQGFNILTDPIWSYRCSPLPFAGPHRRRPPGLRFEDLPPIDWILLSHNHYDHLDLPTLGRLAKTHHPKILAGLGNAAFLKKHGIESTVELDWWQSATLRSDMIATAVPAVHFSARALSDRNKTLWMGFVLQTPGGNIYFAGDTGMGSHFTEIRRRFGPFRLAFLPIGAYLPRWFMEPVHISPQEAVAVKALVEAKTAVAIHFGTFPLGDDGEMEAIVDLQKALATQNDEIRASFWVLDFGENRRIP